MTTGQLLDRLLHDKDLRLRATLAAGLAANVAYAATNAWAGVASHSWWFGTLAFYYLVVSAERFMLVRSVARGHDLRGEYRRLIRCGMLTVLVAVGMVGMAVLSTRGSTAAEHPDVVTYAIALYTLYSVVSASYQVAHGRKRSTPLVRAVRGVSLSCALVSVFSLQNVMLARYASDWVYTVRMNAVTGSVIALALLALGLGTVVAGFRESRAWQRGE